MNRREWPCPACGDPLSLARSRPVVGKTVRGLRLYRCSSHTVATAETVIRIFETGAVPSTAELRAASEQVAELANKPANREATGGDEPESGPQNRRAEECGEGPSNGLETENRLGPVVNRSENDGPPPSAAVDGLAENSGSEFAGKALANTEQAPRQAAEPRTYRCERWPFLSIGDFVRFDRGLFVAKTEKEIETVEASSDLGAGIIVRLRS